ncbi:MAG TPA: sigma-70 family RNA polymerase sigma factor [Bryobacteraceae bacterium]|nr:sigma-70 family RNA polymerase sigma factor [Bryobacteraceae bacterium]
MPETPAQQHAVTQLLSDLQRGKAGAADELLPLVYQELRKIAGAYMRRERVNHTLQATALVHEAYLQLVDQTRVDWKNRAHFFGVAAQLMRRILVEHARAHHAQKRGGDANKVSLEEVINYFPQKEMTLVALDDSLTELERMDARQSRIVELRFFGGLTTEEVAEVIGISTATVEREWRSARAWLHSQLSGLKHRPQL